MRAGLASAYDSVVVTRIYGSSGVDGEHVPEGGRRIMRQLQLDKGAARDRVLELFSVHGLPPPVFHVRRTNGEYLEGEFQHVGLTHRIEIYAGYLVMHESRYRYECYLGTEFESEEALISGFLHHLDRYLSGHEWYEDTAAHRLVTRLKRLWRS
jgi:hypothetical protein